MTRTPKGPILCPRCRKIVGVSETLCPHCGLSNPGAWWRRLSLFRQLHEPEGVLRWILSVNVFFFGLTLLLNPRGALLTANPLMFLTPDTQSLVLMGATGTLPIDRLGRWWSLLSANYLHGGLLHIVFNMMALSQLGLLTIREYGVSRMFTLYTVSGVAGFSLSYLVGIPLTIGASAAICGLMGAAFYYGRSRGGLYGQIIYKQVGGWMLGLFVFGLLVPGINNWGHGGGILAGIALGYLLGYEERRQEGGVHRLLGGLCAAITAGVLLFAAVSALFYRFGV